MIRVCLQVRELGNPKGKKPKEVPQHFEVCEPCRIHLDNGEEIPLPLLARLIKFKLLAIKANDLKRRETEKKVSYYNYSLNVNKDALLISTQLIRMDQEL